MANVLIVEDDPMVAKINKNYIESIEGFHVVGILKDGSNVLEYLQNNKVDLVILDVYLPKGDGVSILKRIRQLETQVDVIMVTAATESEKVENSLRYGAIDYLLKPFEYDRLKQTLENYQDRKGILNFNKSLTQENIDSITISGLYNRESSMQKGLNRHTLNRVVKFIDKHQNILLSAEELAEGLGITKVTVRRYMDHLEKIGFVVQQLEYGSIGRPSYRYKRINK